MLGQGEAEFAGFGAESATGTFAVAYALTRGVRPHATIYRYGAYSFGEVLARRPCVEPMDLGNGREVALDDPADAGAKLWTNNVGAILATVFQRH